MAITYSVTNTLIVKSAQNTCHYPLTTPIGVVNDYTCTVWFKSLALALGMLFASASG